jgi:hypothetical protein
MTYCNLRTNIVHTCEPLNCEPLNRSRLPRDAAAASDMYRLLSTRPDRCLVSRPQRSRLADALAVFHRTARLSASRSPERSFAPAAAPAERTRRDAVWLACRARCHGVYKRHLDESLFARQFRYDAARDASLSAMRAQGSGRSAAQPELAGTRQRAAWAVTDARCERTRRERRLRRARAKLGGKNDSKKGDFWGPAASPRLPEKPPCLLGVRGGFLLLLHQHRLQALVKPPLARRPIPSARGRDR